MTAAIGGERSLRDESRCRAVEIGYCEPYRGGEVISGEGRTQLERRPVKVRQAAKRATSGRVKQTAGNQC